MISEDNEEAYSLMLNKYKPLIDKYADNYYKNFRMLGIEKDELIQEGNLGLINAINSYMIQDKCLFYTFANLVIKREMERHIKKCLRNKHLILTMATSISEPIITNELYMEDILYRDNDCVEQKIDDIYYRDVLYQFKFELSFTQAQIYELRLNNFSNKEIALLLDIAYKKVDNCLRLMKQKFKIYIQTKI